MAGGHSLKKFDNVLMQQNQLSKTLATAPCIIINGSYSNLSERSFLKWRGRVL